MYGYETWRTTFTNIILTSQDFRSERFMLLMVRGPTGIQ
jgi:hypothetical protein